MALAVLAILLGAGLSASQASDVTSADQLQRTRDLSNHWHHHYHHHYYHHHHHGVRVILRA
jgi:hypothetical protein